MSIIDDIIIGFPAFKIVGIVAIFAAYYYFLLQVFGYIMNLQINYHLHNLIVAIIITTLFIPIFLIMWWSR